MSFTALHTTRPSNADAGAHTKTLDLVSPFLSKPMIGILRLVFSCSFVELASWELYTTP